MSLNQNDLKEGRINDQISSQLESISAKVEANVERGRNALEEWCASLSDKSSELGRTLDRYSQEHPWRMASSAFVAGMVFSLLFGRKTSKRSGLF